MALTDKLTAIADVLRNYTGKTDLLTLEDMADEMELILNAITGNKQKFTYKYYNANNIEVFPKLDLTSATDISRMHYGCTKMKALPDYDTRNVTTFTRMCDTCREMVRARFNLSKATNVTAFLVGCTALVELRFDGTININLPLDECPSLDSASVDSIAAAIVDLTGQTAKTVTFHSNVVITQSQRARFTSKNWNISGGKEA